MLGALPWGYPSTRIRPQVAVNGFSPPWQALRGHGAAVALAFSAHAVAEVLHRARGARLLEVDQTRLALPAPLGFNVVDF